MKFVHIAPTLAAGLLMVNLCACSDDDAPALLPTLPTNGGSAVKSIIHNGSLPDCCDWELTYAGGRLTRAVGTSYINNTTLESTFTLGYGPQSVSMTGDGKSKYSIDLNGDKLISRITVDNNIYEFNYWGKSLSNWRKITVDDGFAPIPQYTSSGSLTYENGDIHQITYIENENNPLNTVILTFTPDDHLNVNGLLPEGVTREMGCLGFEHLYYAGLMGCANTHLIRKVEINYSLYPERDYTIEYEYSTDTSGKNIVLCNFRYKNKPASVTYKY